MKTIWKLAQRKTKLQMPVFQQIRTTSIPRKLAIRLLKAAIKIRKPPLFRLRLLTISNFLTTPSSHPTARTRRGTTLKARATTEASRSANQLTEASKDQYRPVARLLTAMQLRDRASVMVELIRSTDAFGLTTVIKIETLGLNSHQLDSQGRLSRVSRIARISRCRIKAWLLSQGDMK